MARSLVIGPTAAPLSYAVVTPAHDEADNLQRLADALAAQTRPPAAWVIVDTGSTDGTPELARRLVETSETTRLVHLGARGRPARGGPIVQAFHAGLDELPPGIDVVVKIDADISFDRDHMDRLLAELEGDDRLGIVGGTAYEQDAAGVWRERHGTGAGVWGAARAYRCTCLRQLLPLEERMGWDTIDLVGAQVRGWGVRLMRDVPFRHHRREAIRDASRYAHWVNQGRAARYMGYRPSYLALRTLYRLAQDRSAVGLLVGYGADALRREPRLADEQILRHVRRQQSVARVPRRIGEALRSRRSIGEPLSSRAPSVLMLVENLSVPFDRRVWQEALALRTAGYEVTVVCPRGSERDSALRETIEGVEIRRFDPAPAKAGALGYAREYAVAFVRMRSLVRRVARERTVDVVHACNPPDFLLLTARALRRRARFVFDHHDLAPELYETRFGRRGAIHRVLLALERLSFRLADVVIATNDSYRDVAVERGGKAPADVFVVRNAPDPNVFHRGAPKESLRCGKRFLVGYVGMMGPQDGVDQALHALAALRRRRDDWHAVLAGDGDVRPEMVRLAAELGLAEVVTFPGLLSQEEVVELLSTADVCLSPEPANPLNDRSTMMKVAEYMSVECPVVAFDLAETRRTAADAALYAADGDVDGYADLIHELLADEALRGQLGAAGRRRVVESLSWEHSTVAFRAAYRRALGLAPEPAPEPAPGLVTASV